MAIKDKTATTIPRLPPITQQEREAALAALQRLRQWRDAMLAGQGGTFPTDSVELLAEMRAERDNDLP